MVTFWFCERCCQAGTAEHDEHIDVMGGFRATADAHHKASPTCSQSDYRLRVLNVGFILRGHVPEWSVEPLKQLLERTSGAGGER